MPSPVLLTTARPTYCAAGDIRGEGPDRRSPAAAVADTLRDRRQCRALGGGAYSDRRPIARIRRGWEYEIHACPDTGALVEAPAPSDADILAAVGEAIAEGHGTRRSRAQRDDWSGWAWTDAGLWRVAVRWPDGASAHEVRPVVKWICSFVC